MFIHHCVAWLYWNPSREAFTIPFLNHPIAWYGVLFVMGFILGYFIINPIIARFLTESRHLSSIDILDWKQLIETLRSDSPLALQLFSLFDSHTQYQLKTFSPASLTPEFKQKILDGLNAFLQNSLGTRLELEILFGKSLASAKQTAYFLTDRLCWFVVAGTVIGARLGLVFFYEWDYFRSHPSEIFKVWHGGLASHGGFLGVILSLYLYLKYVQRWIPQLTLLRLMDYVTIPTTLVCGFIRLGNFINQEILGTATTMPWGVIFGNPADGSWPTPRHPIQLYEAFVYFLIFGVLWYLWKNHYFEKQPGAFVGLSFILGFGSRFFLEFWKDDQASFIQHSSLQMGQLLSLPFILIGILLVWKPKSKAFNVQVSNKIK